VDQALDLATTLSGGPQTIGSHWNITGTLTLPDPEIDEFIVDPDHGPQVDSEQAALVDVLEDEMGTLELNEDDSTNYGCEANAVIHWDLPEVHICSMSGTWC
jgi:hypothetical protein